MCSRQYELSFKTKSLIDSYFISTLLVIYSNISSFNDKPKSEHRFAKIDLKVTSSGCAIFKEKIDLNLLFKSLRENWIEDLESHKTGILKGWVL